MAIDTTQYHRAVTAERLAAFVAVAQAKYEAYMTRNKFDHSIGSDIVASLSGTKYIRVISKSRLGSSQSCYCFVNSVNGDILKGSWKAPVPNGVRGNINAPDLGASCITEHGTAYLRR